jgi:hypothetical protein
MTATTLAPEQAARVSADTFFVLMSLVCVGIAFGGFAVEYWAPTIAGRLPVPAIYHVHGVLASTWTIFLASQAWLIQRGQRSLHRSMGLIGVSLATLMVAAGSLISIASIRNYTAHGFGVESRTFSVVPITALALFAGLVIAALVKARDRETHKRLMLVATFGILEAAVARVFKIFMVPVEVRSLPLLDQPPPPLQAVIGPYIVVDLLIVAAMVYDWRTRGRPHPAYLWAGAATLIVQLIRFPIGPTPAWHAFANWWVSLAG